MRNLYFIINLLRYLSSCGHSWLLPFFWNSLFLWLLACMIPHSPGFLLMSLAVFSISWPGSPLLQTVVWNSPKINFGVSSRYVLYWDQFRIDYHHMWAWGLRLNSYSKIRRGYWKILSFDEHIIFLWEKIKAISLV